jgi:hypothetical protein
MVRIQKVSRYLNLSAEGLVPRIDCPMDQGLLFCNQDLEDNVYLYCLSCDYKRVIGLEFYDDILKALESYEKRIWSKSDFAK